MNFMNEFTVDGYRALIDNALTALLEREPTEIFYKINDDLEQSKNDNQERLLAEIGTGANIYALWVKRTGSDQWVLMYVGQRTRKMIKARLNQHLFKKPTKTQSKIDFVRKEIASGSRIGVTTVLISPDSLRLSVEDEIISNLTKEKSNLPWNLKSRS